MEDNMTNALTIYEQMGQLQTAASALAKSGFFSDVKSEAQAMVKVMAGAELGLPPFASMSGIHIVQGKPVLGANLIATLVKNSGRYDYRVKRSDNAACVLTWYEHKQSVGESSFTIEEAAAAGLAGKGNWKTYPSDMLFARALTRGARRYAPGIFGGAPVYTPEEMGVDVDADGQIVEGIVVETKPDVTHNTVIIQAETVKPQPVAQPAPTVIAPLEYDYDEAAVYEAPAKEFIGIVAGKLEIDEETLKQRMRSLGYTGIPQAAESRVAIYARLKELKQTVEQPVLVTTDAASNGAYSD